MERLFLELNPHALLAQLPCAQVHLEGSKPQYAGRSRFKGHQHSATALDRKSTRLNSSHVAISYAVFCLKKKNTKIREKKARDVGIENEIDHMLSCELVTIK